MKRKIPLVNRQCFICNKDIFVRSNRAKNVIFCKECLDEKIRIRKEKRHIEGKIRVKISHNILKAKENHSRASSARFINGKLKGTKYMNGYFYSEINKKEMYYRSRYELMAYQLLDDKDSQAIIKSWENEPIQIKYNDNEQIKYTVPDILIEYKSGKKQLISVKAEWQTKDIKTILKHQAMEKWCKENDVVFSIWTEKELNIKKFTKLIGKQFNNRFRNFYPLTKEKTNEFLYDFLPTVKAG